jgi:hypothetical protein
MQIASEVNRRMQRTSRGKGVGEGRRVRAGSAGPRANVSIGQIYFGFFAAVAAGAALASISVATIV